MDLSNFDSVGKCEPIDDQNKDEVIDLTETTDEEDNCPEPTINDALVAQSYLNLRLIKERNSYV